MHLSAGKTRAVAAPPTIIWHESAFTTNESQTIRRVNHREARSYAGGKVDGGREFELRTDLELG